jgi:centromeric protein E
MSVKVFTRMRPFNPKEGCADKGFSFDVTDDSIKEDVYVTGSKNKPQSFAFDAVFGANSTNMDTFENAAKPIVDDCLNGYNGVIFAYGQTSSGKTHSMYGSESELGMIPQAMKHIFDHIKNSHREWLLRITFLEIYNEQLFDLLNPDTPSANLVIHAEKMDNVLVKNIKEGVVRSEKVVRRYLAEGNHNKHVAATAMNARSSRSHAVFTMVIESKEIEQQDAGKGENKIAGHKTSLQEKGQVVTVSYLYMVDLAGSERVNKTQATGSTRNEGTYINKSLLTLMRVIQELANNSKKKGKFFVPYRDSKLTRLIKLGLGGNSKLSILCCITPGVDHIDESMSTIRFGSNARKITNKSKINRIMDETALIQHYKREIMLLKEKLEKTGMEQLLTEKQRLELNYEEVNNERQTLKKMVEELTQMILVGSRDEEVVSRVINLRRNSSMHMLLNKDRNSTPTTKRISVDDLAKKRRQVIDDIRRRSAPSGMTPLEENLQDEEAGESGSDEDSVSDTVSDRQVVDQLEQQLQEMRVMLDNERMEKLAQAEKSNQDIEMLRHDKEMLREHLIRSGQEFDRVSRESEQTILTLTDSSKTRDQEHESELQRKNEQIDSLEQKLSEREERYRQVALDLLEQKKRVSILEYEKRVLVDESETTKVKEQRAKLEVQKLSQLLSTHIRNSGSNQNNSLATLLTEIVTLKNRVYQFTDFLQRVKSQQNTGVVSNAPGVSITTTTTTVITLPPPQHESVEQVLLEEAIGPASPLKIL